MVEIFIPNKELVILANKITERTVFNYIKKIKIDKEGILLDMGIEMEE